MTLTVDCVVPDFTGASQLEIILEDYSFRVKDRDSANEGNGYVSMAMWHNESPIEDEVE